MKITDRIRRAKPPCAWCPYKLGLIHTLVDPCPRCRESGYEAFEEFLKQTKGCPFPGGKRK